jgi:UDP-3-O-[3-hydroxymyristoyl] glucosamine N-acyltransferase
VSIGREAVIFAGAFLGCGPTRSLALAGEASPENEDAPGDYGLILEERVEIGSRAVVERGLTRATVIGAGTKIDNMAMIHHGCRLGRNVIVVSTSCLGPNTTAGDWCVFAAQSYVAGNLEIGPKSIVAGRCRLRASVPEGSVMSGEPARGHRDELRLSASLVKLAEYLRENPLPSET